MLHWRDDRLIEKQGSGYGFKEKVFGESDPQDIASWTKFWRPNIKLDMADGDGMGRVLTIDIIEYTDGSPHVMMYYEFDQTVQHEMDLKWFPFDTQALTFYFMLEALPPLPPLALSWSEFPHVAIVFSFAKCF